MFNHVEPFAFKIDSVRWEGKLPVGGFHVKLSGTPMRPTTPKGPKVAHGSIATGAWSIGEGEMVPKLAGETVCCIYWSYKFMQT